MIDDLKAFAKEAKRLHLTQFADLRVDIKEPGKLTSTATPETTAALLRVLTEVAMGHTDPKTQSLCLIMAQVTSEILGTGKLDFPAALAEASRLGVSTIELQPALAAVNETILRQYEVEITSHGLLRSFRFWSKDERSAYLRLAMELANTIRELTPDVSLGYGFALGVERDGDFMPHDDDIDIIAATDRSKHHTITDALTELSLLLHRRGWSVYGTWPAHRKAHRPGASQVIDIFVGFREDDRVSFIPGRRKQHLYGDIFPARNREVLGVECPFPANIEAYLTTVYGEDWRTPNTNFHHNWSAADYSDLLRKTLSRFPFQAVALIEQGYGYAVVDEDNGLLSLHRDKPSYDHRVRDLSSLAMQERILGIANWSFSTGGPDGTLSNGAP